MKLVSLVLGSLAAIAGTAHAETHVLKGSDTLAGVMTDAIIASGLDNGLSYQGGGSGLGESAILARTQGIAAMSRAFKPEAITSARAAGIEVVPHVIGLDGIGVFVNNANTTAAMSIDTVKKIFTCAATKWEQVPGSGRTGAIKAFRRNDVSGTTDAFKAFTGITAFGACVKVVEETADIANVTATDALAVGYSGLTAHRDGNKPVGIAKADGGPSILPTVTTIRNKTYPFARELYVYEASGALRPNGAEAALLGKLLDRSFLDPILQDNEFYTVN